MKEPAPPKDKFVTVQSLSVRLSCTEQHIYNMIRSGLIVAVKIGDRAIRISENSVEEYLAGNVVNPQEYFQTEDQPKSPRSPVARSSWISR